MAANPQQWSGLKLAETLTLFGRHKKKKTHQPIDLDALIAQFGQAASFWQAQPQPAILAQARFADACRDVKVRPVPTASFAQSWDRLNEESRIRFCIALSAFDSDVARHRLPALCDNAGNVEPGLTILHNFATQLELLTAEMIQQSDVRLEEYSRHFCAAVGLTIKDEDRARSTARLHEIDFGRLMKEAEAARSSAEDRMAYLRRLQEEQEATRRPRRGKW